MMKVLVRKSFLKDVKRIQNKQFKEKLLVFIKNLKKYDNFREIPNLKKLKGYDNFYRIRLWN